MKAIVIDIMNNEAALLKEDGSILKVADQGFQLGQEVILETVCEVREEVPSDNKKASSKVRHISRGVFAAAIAAALLITISIGAYAMPYGTVTQGDASIEYTINVFDRVIDVKANDEAGKAALKEAGDLTHEKIDVALNKTISAGTSINVETGNENHDKVLKEELDHVIRKSMDEQEIMPSEPAADVIVPESEIRDSEPQAETFDPKSSEFVQEKPSVHDPEVNTDHNSDDNKAEQPPNDSFKPVSESEPVKPESDMPEPDDFKPMEEKKDTVNAYNSDTSVPNSAVTESKPEIAGPDDPDRTADDGMPHADGIREELGEEPGEESGGELGGEPGGEPGVQTVPEQFTPDKSPEPPKER